MRYDYQKVKGEVEKITSDPVMVDLLVRLFLKMQFESRKRKISYDDYMLMIKYRQHDWTYDQLAKRFGLSISQVRELLNTN